VRVNGKIHISVTRVYDGGNIILKNFDSRDELIQVCFKQNHLINHHINPNFYSRL
jgi:hypothetical protein